MPLERSALRLTDAELGEFLENQRTARVATVGPGGDPHVVPLWYVWHQGALYVTSLNKSRRMADIERGSKVAVCIDDGEEYGELRGAVLYGSFEPAGDGDDTVEVRRLLGAKYWQGIEVPETKSHSWMVLQPTKIVSWDFRKIPQGRDKRLEALND